VTLSDPADPTQRRDALEAAEAAVEAYVRPAEPLLTRSDTGLSVGYDLEALAGRELPGLALGVVAADLDGVDDHPSDEAFAAALADAGISVDDPARREDLLTAWLARRTLFALRDLVLQLQQHPALTAEQARDERDRLERLRDAPLPTLDRQALDVALARWRAR
jgi:hypothetical protein